MDNGNEPHLEAVQFHPWSRPLQRVSHNASRFVKPYNVTLIFVVPIFVFVFVFAYCLKLFLCHVVKTHPNILGWCENDHLWDIGYWRYFFAHTLYLIKHYRAKRPAPPRINNAVRPEIPTVSNTWHHILVILKATMMYMRTLRKKLLQLQRPHQDQH